MTVATFARPWRKLPQILMFYAGFGVLGAALLTFLHVQFPDDVATLPTPAPIEHTPDLRTDIPRTSRSELIEQERRIADVEAALQLTLTLLERRAQPDDPAQAQQFDRALDELRREQARLAELRRAPAERFSSWNDLRMVSDGIPSSWVLAGVRSVLTLLGVLFVVQLIVQSLVQVFPIVPSRRGPSRSIDAKSDAGKLNSPPPKP